MCAAPDTTRADTSKIDTFADKPLQEKDERYHQRLESRVRKAEKAIAGQQPQDRPSDTLKEEHEEVSALLKKLSTAKRAGTQIPAGEIKANLVPHVRAEEKVLYDTIIAVKDKTAASEARASARDWALQIIRSGQKIDAQVIEMLDKRATCASPCPSGW